MKPDIKIAWATLLFLAALGLAMAVTSMAHADPLPFVDRIASLVPRFGSRKVELVDPREFAVAVDTACKSERECVARLVTMAIAESGLSLDVSQSVYSPHQGDSFIDKDGVRQHRARGLWQIHRNARNADTWESTDLLVQARAARSMQLGALAECRSYRAVAPEVGMFRILSGRGCAHLYSGEQMRVELLAKVRRAL